MLSVRVRLQRRGSTVSTSSGITLLVLIALIVAYVVVRTRRRMGLLVTGRTWIAVMVGVVIAVLALWAAQTH
jgi:hypothetical protein